MKSTLILPTEQCVTPGVIKRALLNYEKVYLKNPDDRDFVGGNDLLSIANGSTIGMSLGMAGPAKPLGKESGHDLKFEKVLAEFKPALEEGSLVIMETRWEFNLNSAGMGYRIDPLHLYVYSWYRDMVTNEEFIKAASRGLNTSWLKTNNYDELAPTGGEDSIRYDDEKLNNKLPYLGRFHTEEERVILTRMVHARLASISRNLMVCDLNGLVPFTDNIGYSAVIRQMQSNFSTLVEEANDGSSELESLDLVGKVEKVMFSDYLDQDKITKMPVKGILKLRTKIWGKYGESKQALEKTLLSIALETKDVTAFEKCIKEQFDKFLKENRDYIHERNTLGMQLACDFAKVSVPVAGLAQRFVSAPSLGFLMSLACPLAAILLEQRLPEIRKILKQQKEITSLPAYNLYNYFKPFVK